MFAFGTRRSDSRKLVDPVRSAVLNQLKDRSPSYLVGSSVDNSKAINKGTNSSERKIHLELRHEEQVKKEFLFIDITLLQSKGLRKWC